MHLLVLKGAECLSPLWRLLVTHYFWDVTQVGREHCPSSHLTVMHYTELKGTANDLHLCKDGAQSCISTTVMLTATQLVLKHQQKCCQRAWPGGYSPSYMR